MSFNNIADNAVAYAMAFLGRPYKWGGENPITGWDCSGFVQEILASVGYDPKGDQTAQGLYNYFSAQYHISVPRKGSLAFYGQSENEIKHIAMCVNDTQVIEAAGGNSKTKTIHDAALDNAFVRVRPLMYRSDYLQSLFTFF